ncbi:MAG: glycoside hydrolase family 3 protein, partial [Spirochaetaceae bacterium]
LLSGHLSFPKVTGDTTPASFSTWFNKKLLRESMGYTGIIITDDLYMYGAIDYGQTHGESIADMVVRSIRSGSDMIMLSSTPEFNGDIWNTLIATYKSDPDFRQVLDDAVRRILRVKLEYLHDDVRQVPLQPNASNLRNELPSNATRQFFMEQALRSVSLIGDTLPTIKEGDRVLLAGLNYAFSRIGREFFPGVSEYRFQNRNFYFSTSRDREAMVEMAEQYDVILFALSDPNSAQVLQELKEYKDKIIVFSLLSPIYLTTMPWVQNGIAVFGWYDDSVRAGYSVLTGFAPAIGSMPINIENSRKPQ